MALVVWLGDTKVFSMVRLHKISRHTHAEKHGRVAWVCLKLLGTPLKFDGFIIIFSIKTAIVIQFWVSSIFVPTSAKKNDHPPWGTSGKTSTCTACAGCAGCGSWEAEVGPRFEWDNSGWVYPQRSQRWYNGDKVEYSWIFMEYQYSGWYPSVSSNIAGSENPWTKWWSRAEEIIQLNKQEAMFDCRRVYFLIKLESQANFYRYWILMRRYSILYIVYEYGY